MAKNTKKRQKQKLLADFSPHSKQLPFFFYLSSLSKVYNFWSFSL